MAQRYRRRHRRLGRRTRGILGQFTKWLPLAAFESTFLGNTIDNVNAQTTLGGKLKTLINAHTGKVLGLNLFSDVPRFGVSIGFQNIGNPLTIAGVTLLVAGIVGKRFNIPYTAKLKGIGAKIAFPSAIGSLFTGDSGTGFITPTPTLNVAQTTGGTTF